MKKRKSSLAIGFPTVATILVLLIFSCTAMLSLSRAQADRMTASHGWDVTSDYFAADSRAQALLGEMEEAAALPPGEAGLEMEAMLNDQGVAARYDAQTRCLSFPLPAGEAGTLSVRLRLLGDGTFTIEEWRLVAHEQEDSALNP